jgi:hypothetical protein
MICLVTDRNVGHVQEILYNLARDALFLLTYCTI